MIERPGIIMTGLIGREIVFQSVFINKAESLVIVTVIQRAAEGQDMFYRNLVAEELNDADISSRIKTFAVIDVAGVQFLPELVPQDILVSWSKALAFDMLRALFIQVLVIFLFPGKVLFGIGQQLQIAGEIDKYFIGKAVVSEEHTSELQSLRH